MVCQNSKVQGSLLRTCAVQNTWFVSDLLSGHACVQTSGFSLTLRNRGKGGWARDLRGRRQNCLPRYSAGVKSRSVVLGHPS